MEDNPGDARLLQELLEEYAHQRFELDCARTLADAIEQLTTTPPDALIVDLSLPDSQGLVTFSRLQEHLPEIPLLVMTGLDDQDLAIQAVREGAQDYLVKGNVTSDLLGRSLCYAIERHRTDHKLATVQRMEAIGRLAGGISHDFNNILLAILGYTELLLDGLEPGPDHDDALKHISNAAQRGASLTRQLLAFSRQQVLARRILDLNEVVRGLQMMLQRLIGEDVEMRLRLDPDIGHVRADPNQLQQILMNLTVNARDAMPRHGTLTIETANIDLDARHANEDQSFAPGSYVMLAVSDTGTGMDAFTRRRIFEPFFSTKEDGTGLGLSTVYGIVTQTNGFIGVKSEPDRGTTFTVYLPRLNEVPVAPHSPDVAAIALPPAQRTLLLAEDDSSVRTVCRTFLERAGYRVLEAATGREALRLGRDHRVKIDLLLSDVVMPQISGPALADRLRETRPTLRVLFISGYTSDVVRRHGVFDPDTNFLQKPFTRAELLSRVREALVAPVAFANLEAGR